MSMLDSVLIGLVLGLCIISAIAIPYSGLILIWLSAKFNTLFTTVKEGTSKAVMRNTKFDRFILSYSNARFYKDLGICGRKAFKKYRAIEGITWPIDDYDTYFDMPRYLIEEANDKIAAIKQEECNTLEVANSDNEKKGRVYNLIKFLNTLKFITAYTNGIYWIGFPPTIEIHRERFRWLSIEEIADEDGKSRKKITMRNEILDYVQHKIDTYPISLSDAETFHMVPLDGLIAVTARTENPRKSLFGTEKWMEVLESRLGSNIREVLANAKYKEIVRGRLDEDEKSKEERVSRKIHVTDNILSDENLGGILTFLRRYAGIHVISVEIIRVDPSKELHEMFVRASTFVYVAKEQAEAHKIEGAGLGARDKKHFEEIAEAPNGSDIAIARELGRTNVLSLGATDKGVIPSIIVGDETNKKSDAKENESVESTITEKEVK